MASLSERMQVGPMRLEGPGSSGCAGPAAIPGRKCPVLPHRRTEPFFAHRV